MEDSKLQGAQEEPGAASPEEHQGTGLGHEPEEGTWKKAGCEGGTFSRLVAHYCAEHAHGRWRDNHRTLYTNYMANKAAMRRDFQQLKFCPLLSFVEDNKFLCRKMLEKWTVLYNEKAVVKAWKKSWGGKTFCRAQINSLAPNGGGLPGDTNALESINGTQKEFTEGHRHSLCDYLGDGPITLPSFIQRQSRTDLAFGDGFSGRVHNKTFYLVVHSREQAGVSPVTCSFLDEKTGELLVTAQKTLNRLARPLKAGNTPIVKLAECKKAVNTKNAAGDRSWTQQ